MVRQGPVNNVWTPPMKAQVFLAAIVLQSIALLIGQARGDTFGSAANTFTVDFVAIEGAPNTPAPYRIGKYEISEDMINKANVLGNLGITHDNRGANKPVTSVSWFEAVSFINWLNTSTGNAPAYKFDDAGNFHLWSPADPGYD